MVYIDNLSKITLLIEPMYQGGSLSKASGFVVEENGKSYLITNWHVVSGRNAETGVCLDEKHGSLPDTLKIRFHGKIENTWVYKEVETAQFSLEVNCQFEKNIDVVAIPLEGILTNDIEVYLLDLKLSKTNIRVQCADPVSIIGFLDGKYFQGMYEYPIWKTGHIASEFDIEYEGVEVFLVDATTGGGMSGSPVYLIQNGVHKNEGGNVILTIGDKESRITRFLGVYSGRNSDKYNDIKVGRVWKPKYIYDAIKALES